MHRHVVLIAAACVLPFSLTAAAAAAATAAAGTHAGGAAAPTYSAAYRKDAWLPQYIETEPDPVDGGRLHIVGAAATSGLPAAVYLNGTYLNMSLGISPTTWAADWVRVEPVTGLVAGSPFWVSLHSRAKGWDALRASGGTATLVVLDAAGAALINGSFAVIVPRVRVTWVTTGGNRTALHMYVHADGAGHTASRVRVNGFDVTAALPSDRLAVPANESVLWSLPPAAVGGAVGIAPGAVWTVEVAWAEAGTPPTAAGGLLFREFFPLETWPTGRDCPLPTVNDSAYAFNRAHGVDTFFLGSHQDAACNSSVTSVDVLNKLAPRYGFYALVAADVNGLPPSGITDDSRLAGWFLGDEGDTKVDDKARSLLAAVVATRAMWPGQPTYSGGASNKYTGAYAGITDVKGMDAYIACCAPHYALLAMPARGSYDYLANTRVNHAPGPTWLYSQGFFGGWDDKSLRLTRQVDPAELAVQLASVVAAGGKGLMLFETDTQYAALPAYDTLRTLLREMGAMRELYRGGDPTGVAVAIAAGGAPAGDDVVVEAVLGPRALVIVAINTRAAPGNEYNDITCLLGAPHWTFAPVPLSAIAAPLPAGFVVVDAFEVFNATVLPGALPLQPLGGRTVGLPNVTLGVEGPGSANCTAPARAIVRTFVLAADASLRGELAVALAAGPGAI